MKNMILGMMIIFWGVSFSFSQQKQDTKKAYSVKSKNEAVVAEKKVFYETPKNNIQDLSSDELVIKASSNDPVERRRAIMDMVNTRDLKYVAVIEKYLEDENKIVKLSAIEALGVLRSQASANKIVEILSKTTDDDIKNSCIIALSYMPKLENPKIMAEIALKDKNDLIRISAIRTLGAFGINLIEDEIIKILEDKKSSNSLKVAAINYLSSIKSEKSKDLFKKLLKNEDNSIRIASIRAIGDMQIKDYITELRVLSGENIPEIQLEAAYSLAKMGDNFALDSIYKYLDSSNPVYRDIGLNIIGMVGDEKSIKILEEKISKTTDESFKSYLQFTREKIKSRVGEK